MSRKCICFESLLFHLLLCVSVCNSLKHFKPGPPLTEEAFHIASKLKIFDADAGEDIDMDVLDDDIISSSMIRRTFSVANHLWPDGVVPYSMDEEYDEKGRIFIARAFQEFEKNTCVRFVPREDQKDYIQLISDKGCSSYVGRIGGPQTVTLGRGCYSLGIMTHELMHTLGFIHEQSRRDRNDYVTVIWENIQEGRKDNFKIYNWYTDHILKEPYDYSSILHYNKFAFSKDPKKKPTIEPKQSSAAIGQRKALSKGDIHKINKAYRCPTA